MHRAKYLMKLHKFETCSMASNILGFCQLSCSPEHSETNFTQFFLGVQKPNAHTCMRFFLPSYILQFQVKFSCIFYTLPKARLFHLYRQATDACTKLRLVNYLVGIIGHLIGMKVYLFAIILLHLEWLMVTKCRSVMQMWDWLRSYIGIG